MHSYSPVQIAAFVIALLTVVGIAVSFFRKSATFHGYSEYQADIQKIASSLGAETFRDGDDLVLVGNYKQQPVQVRFSYAESTPGLNLRMQAPVSFTFSVVPKGQRASEGRVLIRTGHDMFDARFAARTDHPSQAKMLIGGRASLANIEKLCCSSNTFLTMTRGAIELSELTIPSPYTARHVLDHIEAMKVVSDTVAEIPGAETVKVTPYKRERTSIAFRAAIVVGAIVAMVIVASHPSGTQDPALAESKPARDTGVPLNDATVIPGLDHYHAARPEELDTDASSWISSGGETPSGRMPLDLAGRGAPLDTAYLLFTDDPVKTRVALVEEGHLMFDNYFPNAEAIARVPRDNIAGIEWSTPPATGAAPVGDGVLIVMKNGDQTKGVVIFPANGRMQTAIAKSYTDINLT